MTDASGAVVRAAEGCYPQHVQHEPYGQQGSADRQGEADQDGIVPISKQPREHVQHGVSVADLGAGV